MRFLLRTASLVPLGLLLSLAAPPLLVTIAIPPAIAQSAGSSDAKAEADRLFNQGIEQFNTSQFEAALQSWQQALKLYQSLHDRQSEGAALGNLGIAYLSLGDYAKAIDYQQQHLAIARAIHDRQGEGQALGNLGNAYFSLGDYAKAIDYQQQWLAIARAIHDRQGEGKALGNLGNAYFSLGDYAKAIDYQQQVLAIARAIHDRQSEGAALGNLGIAYFSLGDYAKAIDYQQQLLAIARAIHDRQGEGKALGNLGNAYFSLGDYAKAIDYQQQWLAIARAIHDRQSEGAALGNLGNAYLSLGDYAKAIDYQQQLLAIAREIHDRQSEGKALGNLGLAYAQLGDYAKAIDYQQQDLAIARAIHDRQGEGQALGNLGNAYFSLGDYAKAIDYHQQRLAIAREIHDRQSEGKALGNLGNAYFSLGDYAKAIDYHQQSLAIAREIHDRQSEGKALGNLGLAYAQLGDYAKAIDYEQQDLAIAREIQDRESEGIALSNIGDVLKQQNQSDLAIVLYKQSVNVREGIRQSIQSLPQSQQESYTQTVAYTYRQLADLLLSQGRVLEAQQVLELLKIQELRDYTRDANVAGTPSRIALTAIEQQILTEFNSLIAFGQQVDVCEQTQCPQLSQLHRQREALIAQYNERIDTILATIRQQRANDPAFYDPSNLSQSARSLVAQPNTLLIYPLVLENKLWLLWVGQGGVVNRIEVPVNQQDLGKTAEHFRELLGDPSLNLMDLQRTSQQLYTWLMQPLEKEIQANHIQHLVFALDRVTRYIPMAALFDGKQYLIENYTVSTILSAELTNTSDRPSFNPDSTSVLALGMSEGMGGFNPLPHVPDELNAIVRLHPNDSHGIYPGLEYLNRDFTFAALSDHLTGHQILHIATHGSFTPGENASFLVLGTGDKLTISQINTLYFSGIRLVVLSGCQTALGGPGADGIEIAGLSYYFLKNKADAVMASLWSVNDDSTSQLMEQFYQNLSTGTMTKPEALRQAQIALITGHTTSTNTNRSSLQYKEGQNSTASLTRNLSHPFYWAPFVLIGNDL